MRELGPVLKSFLKLLKIDGRSLAPQCFRDPLVLFVYLSISESLVLEGVPASRRPIFLSNFKLILLQNACIGLLHLEGRPSRAHWARIIKRYSKTQSCFKHPGFPGGPRLIKAEIPKLWLVSYIANLCIQSGIFTIYQTLRIPCGHRQGFLGDTMKFGTRHCAEGLPRVRYTLELPSSYWFHHPRILKWQFQAIDARFDFLKIPYNPLVFKSLLYSWRASSSITAFNCIYSSLGCYASLQFLRIIQLIKDAFSLFGA